MSVRVHSRERKTTDGKGGLEGLKKRVEKLGLGRVHVGIPGSATEADGTRIADIAATHEFGDPSRGIPERSFLRASIIKNRKNYVKMARNGAKKVAAGTMESRMVYSLIGTQAQGDVWDYFILGRPNFVPLKPATIKRKGSSAPLIDSGQMRQSITHIVTEG